MAEMAGRQSDDLALVIAEVRRLIAAQRGALRRADFAALLATAGACHRLAARIDGIQISPSSCLEDDLRELQQEILRQGQLLDTLRATARFPHAYTPRPAGQPGSSLLLDHYT